MFIEHQTVQFIPSVLTSVFFLNTLVPQYNTSGHFWTLGVEWQFYITIPFLLIYQNKIGFDKAFLAIFGSLTLFAVVYSLFEKSESAFMTSQIIFRGMEFANGIIVARVVSNSKFVLKNRVTWLILFILLTYGGRILISSQILSLAQGYSNLIHLTSYIIMSAGFAGILYLSITSVKWLDMILGNQVFKTMGKISYSFYLWHSLVQIMITDYIFSLKLEMHGIAVPVLATLAAAIILYPISLLSYRLLEKPFLSIGNMTTK